MMMTPLEQHAAVMAETQAREIAHLKHELQKEQMKNVSKMENSLYSPELFDHYTKVAKHLCATNLVPTSYRGKPEDLFVAMAMGYRLGLPIETAPLYIAVVNGRPCIWGDGLMGLVLSKPQCEQITEDAIIRDGQVVGYQCTVVRSGYPPHTVQFTVQDAQVAGLLKKQGAWSTYPKRMLQLRARSLAIRDRFADVISGIEIKELVEEEMYIKGEAVEVPQGPTQTEKLKQLLNIPVHGTMNDSITVEELNQREAEVQVVEVEAPKKKKKSDEPELTVHNTGRDDVPATENQIANIEAMLEEKGFDAERKKKAYDYFKIQSLDELSEAQAVVFIMQLEKS